MTHFILLKSSREFSFSFTFLYNIHVLINLNFESIRGSTAEYLQLRPKLCLFTTTILVSCGVRQHNQYENSMEHKKPRFCECISRIWAIIVAQP